jgi:hypothetical protein
MLHTRGPSSGILKLFQAIDVIARGDIPKLVALVLGANKLLAMAKDISGIRLIVIGEGFFNLLVFPLSYSFGVISRAPIINLEYRPLDAMKPSLLASKPSSTYTLIWL